MLKELWKGFWTGLKYVILSILILELLAALFSGEIRVAIVLFITFLFWVGLLLKVKKVWNVFQYVILLILIWGVVELLYSGEIILAAYRSRFVLFWGSMMLKEKLSDSNKVVSMVYYISSMILLVTITLERFGVLNI